MTLQDMQSLHGVGEKGILELQSVISKIKEVLLLDYSKLDKWYGGEKSKYLDEPLVQYSV